MSLISLCCFWGVAVFASRTSRRMRADVGSARLTDIDRELSSDNLSNPEDAAKGEFMWQVWYYNEHSDYSLLRDDCWWEFVDQWYISGLSAYDDPKDAEWREFVWGVYRRYDSYSKFAREKCDKGVTLRDYVKIRKLRYGNPEDAAKRDFMRQVWFCNEHSDKSLLGDAGWWEFMDQWYISGLSTWDADPNDAEWREFVGGVYCRYDNYSKWNADVTLRDYAKEEKLRYGFCNDARWRELDAAKRDFMRHSDKCLLGDAGWWDFMDQWYISGVSAYDDPKDAKWREDVWGIYRRYDNYTKFSLEKWNITITLREYARRRKLRYVQKTWHDRWRCTSNKNCSFSEGCQGVLVKRDGLEDRVSGCRWRSWKSGCYCAR